MTFDAKCLICHLTNDPMNNMRMVSCIEGNRSYCQPDANSTLCSEKFYPILRFNFEAVHFSVTKMLVFPDFRGMYKLFGI